MNQFNLGQFLTKVIDYSMAGLRGSSTESTQKSPPQPSQESFSQNLVPKQQLKAQTPQTIIINMLGVQARPLQNIQMSHIASLDSALYVKELMNLPKNMQEMLTYLQKAIKTEAETPVMLTNNINISQIALLLQQNGKEAANKLIMAMANTSKQGITDLSQMKETLKLINASVSSAGQNNSAQTLKSLMLLYLPWIPLPQRNDFEMEMGISEEKSGESESSLTIMIATKNYGNVKATLFLQAQNSVGVLINCSQEFPKEELLKRIKMEGQSHSIQSSIVFEQKATKQNENPTLQAKINMSNANVINPFLLLMAHSVIKHTIEIDKNA